MTNFATGRQAEQTAVEYLITKGYQVLQQNWRTRYCEIDVVAKHANTVYFVEVKYRATAAQGTGLDYITPKKLRQMTFAAEMWVQANDWSGDYALAALEISGSHFDITAFITNL